jgi:hypothetical protein
MFVPPGVLQSNIPYDAYIASLSPVIWFKFQDVNYNTGTNLTDSSGNARHIARFGVSNISAGAAFRTTTTKSANMASVGSSSNGWGDNTNLVTGFVHGQTAWSYLFSLKRPTLAGSYSKFLGWRTNNSTSVTASWSQFSSGTGVVLGCSNSSGTDFENTQTNNDTDVHVYGATFGGSIWRRFKDASSLGTTNIGTATVYTSAGSYLTIGGSMSSAGSANFMIDNFVLFNYQLSVTQMNNAMTYYMAEII